MSETDKCTKVFRWDGREKRMTSMIFISAIATIRTYFSDAQIASKRNFPSSASLNGEKYLFLEIVYAPLLNCLPTKIFCFKGIHHQLRRWWLMSMSIINYSQDWKTQMQKDVLSSVTYNWNTEMHNKYLQRQNNSQFNDVWNAQVFYLLLMRQISLSFLWHWWQLFKLILFLSH